MTVKRYSLSGDRMFPAKSGQWVAAEDHDALRSRLAEALDVIRDVTLHGGITNWRDLENRMVACLRPADSASVQHEPDPPYGSEAYLFRELMAIMHGDGGHYHAQHGAQKAYEDACTKYWRLVVTAENTAADAGRVRGLLREVVKCDDFDIERGEPASGLKCAMPSTGR